MSCSSRRLPRPAAQEGDAGWIGQEGESGARRQNRPVREAEGAQGPPAALSRLNAGESEELTTAEEEKRAYARARGLDELFAQEGDAGWIGQEGESGARRQNRPVREAEGAQGLSMPERCHRQHSLPLPQPRCRRTSWKRAH
jgi:hypothetical protein